MATPAPVSATASTLGYDNSLTCALGVSDLAASRRWYEEVLGFAHLYTLDEIGWCELATTLPGVNVGLSEVEAPEVKGGATLTFGVRDIEEARARMEGHNVRFDGPTREVGGMVKLATFFDPDGNTFMLSEGIGEG